MHLSLLRCGLVMGGLLAVPGPAWAQPAANADDTNFAEARRHFEAGVAAMQAENWTRALEAFEHSHQLRRSAAASLNLGITLHRLGRLLESRVRLQEFFELATPTQRQTHEAETQRLMGEINRRVGRIRITALEPAHAALTVDGRRVTLNDTQEVTVDPGDRTLRAEAAGFQPFTRQVGVGPGVTESLAVRLEPVPAPPPPVVTVTPAPAINTAAVMAPVLPPRPASSGSILTRWWFWTGVGVVAGATVGVIWANRRTEPLPGGNTNMVINAVLGSPSP